MRVRARARVRAKVRAEGGGRGRLVAREELLDRGGEAAAPSVGAARAVVVVAHLQEGG